MSPAHLAVEQGCVDVSVDSTTCRAHQHAAGARKRPPQIGTRRAPRQHRPDEGLGRSRGGLTCKIHLAGEGGRRPLALLITPGQWGDAQQFTPVMERIRVGSLRGGRPHTRPDHLGGDKAYSSRRNRRYLRRRQIKHTTPEPRNQRANLKRRGSKRSRTDHLGTQELPRRGHQVRQARLSVPRHRHPHLEPALAPIVTRTTDLRRRSARRRAHARRRGGRCGGTSPQ